MSNPGYKPIKDAIVSVLGTVSSLKVVYGKEEKVLKQFPAACVSAKEHQSDFHSIGTAGANKHVYQHFIRVYFRTDEKNDADYEDVLESVADDVIFALESNLTLNGVCAYSLPVSGIWRNGEKESAVRIFELTLSTTVRVNRGTGVMV